MSIRNHDKFIARKNNISKKKNKTYNNFRLLCETNVKSSKY